MPEKRRHGEFYCIRTSLNGVWIHQVCDPVSKRSGLQIQGVVKDRAYDFWQELQDHHYIDFQTRFLAISIQTHSANTGLDSYAKLAFEFPLSGGVSPSSLVFVTRSDGTTNGEVNTWLYLSLFTFVVFILFEVLCFFEEGADYLRSIWNYLDVINFVLFILMYSKLAAYYTTEHSSPVNNPLVEKLVGFHELYSYNDEISSAIAYLAMNLCLLCFKSLKILLAVVPKCKELIDVLAYCAFRLISMFAVTMLAITGFGLMFWVLLGSTMSGFATQMRSIITMTRAALGDFDVSAIDENSPSATNLVLFLFGVTVVQFVLLSMFFSILGEAQAVIISRNRDLETEDLIAQSLEDNLKRVEEMDKHLSRGLTRLSGFFGGSSFFGGNSGKNGVGTYSSSLVSPISTACYDVLQKIEVEPKCARGVFVLLCMI